MMRILFYLLWLMLLAVLQPTLGSGIAVFSIAPNLFYAFIVLIGLYRGKTEGAVCGIVFGLVYDILIGRLIGVSSLCGLYLGFGAGILGQHFFSGAKRIAAMGAIAVGTVLASMVYAAAILMTGGSVPFWTAMLRIAVPEGVYSGLIGWLLSFPMVASMKLFKMKQIS